MRLGTLKLSLKKFPPPPSICFDSRMGTRCCFHCCYCCRCRRHRRRRCGMSNQKNDYKNSTQIRYKQKKEMNNNNPRRSDAAATIRTMGMEPMHRSHLTRKAGQNSKSITIYRQRTSIDENNSRGFNPGTSCIRWGCITSPDERRPHPSPTHIYTCVRILKLKTRVMLR